jgi:predicted Zn finger-like uncharacterized protein
MRKCALSPLWVFLSDVLVCTTSDRTDGCSLAPAVPEENAMKVQCGQCPAKYAVSDERIADKKVRIRCKRCNAAIVVDGRVDPPLITSSPARKSARPAPSTLPPESTPPDWEPESRPSPRPVAHTIMGGLEAPVAERLSEARHAGFPPQRPPRRDLASAVANGGTALAGPQAGIPPGDRHSDPGGVHADRWRVALTKEDLRWMTTSEITEAYQVGAVKLETFVFRAGMPTWVTLLEVPEIVEALAETGDEAALASRARRAGPSSLPPPRKPAAHGAAESGDEALLQPEGAVEDASDGLASAIDPERGTREPEGPGPLTRGETEPLLAPLAVPPGVGAPAAPADSQAAEASLEGSPVEPAHPGVLTESGDEPAQQGLINLPPTKSKTKSSSWIWLIVLALLIGATLALLAHRFGLKLR